MVRELLQLFGHDPGREGLAETPWRVARFYQEFLRAVPFFSLCEHHLLPFVGTATVGYVPAARIVGLSKIPRIVHHFARGLQNQERLVQQVANCLVETLQPKGVGVILHARHLCMEMRGVQIAGTVTTTSALRGVFLEDARCRREFLDFDAKTG